MITELSPKQIFVFGSNLSGNHVGGAAKQALERFGAKMGIGEGITGQCYAFPTLDENLEKRSRKKLKLAKARLYRCCLNNSDEEFLLTKVGCGIAGYEEGYIINLFKNSPRNLIKPKGW